MSKVLTETPASSAENVEQPNAPPASEQVEGFEQAVEALSPAAQAHWQLTGDLAAAQALDEKESGAPAASPPAKKEKTPPVASQDGPTEPASGPGEEEPQPKTPQERNFANLRKKSDQLERDNLALKAKLEVYERDHAASGKPAPAATETKPVSGPEKPKRPRLSDPQYDTIEKYEAAMDAYEQARDTYNAQQLEARERDHTERQSEIHRIETWSEQVTTAKSKYKDFESVAFSSEIPASFAAIPRLQMRKDGAELAYFLGKHPEEAARLAEQTDLPGVHSPDEYRAFLKKAMTDPQAARALARAEALADAAFDQLSAQMVKPAAPPKSSRIPAKPTAEVRVEANAKPVDDELGDAIARGDQDSYERIMNRRAVEEKSRGGFTLLR